MTEALIVFAVLMINITLLAILELAIDLFKDETFKIKKINLE